MELCKLALNSTETVIFLTFLPTFSAYLPSCTGLKMLLPGCKGMNSFLSDHTGVNAVLPDCRGVNTLLPDCIGTQARLPTPLRSSHHTTPAALPREQCLSLSGKTFCVENTV